jgi:allophanate hydrolase
VIEKGRTASAVDTFAALYRLAELRRAIEPILDSVDAIVTPTAGTIYRIAELEADPLQPNSALGYYTNFMNLLDLAAVALPAGFTTAGLPFGITLFADAFGERALLALSARLEQAQRWPLGATGQPHPPLASVVTLPPGYTAVAVCGAHLSGLALNHQLTERGGFFLEATHTAPQYRFYALPGGPPFRPGLVRVRDGGAAIGVELWALPVEHYGSFVAGIPAPLGIGSVQLADGRCVQGFVCEGYAVVDAEDITAHGDWRRYLAARNAASVKRPPPGGIPGS